MAAPPVAVQVPPVAAGAVSVVATANDVTMQVLATVIELPVGFWQVSSLKKFITGPAQVTPEGAPQEHAVHVAAGAVRVPLPSNAGVAAKPAAQAGGALAVAA